MRHSHGSFSNAMIAKKRWTSPVLTSTNLTDAEQEEAMSSSAAAIALGVRLKAARRI